MSGCEVVVREESWPLAKVFTISRGASREAFPLLVELRADGAVGRGECSPTARYRETTASVRAQIDALRPRLEAGMDRFELAAALPPGAARNALDCALWDLDAKRAGRAVWELAGLDRPAVLTTAYTLSIEPPRQMALAAAEHAARPLLKLKMAGDGDDLQRVRAVRERAADAVLIVDANEAWSLEDYRVLVPALSRLGVAMIEQPFPAGQDEVLAALTRPIPVCADESCHSRDDLPALAERYDMINIKLDKTGGLSEALALKHDALAAGLEIMVGCMVGTSLAMAPALLVGQGARFVDVDGPLLLARDREPGLRFDGSRVAPAAAELWG